MSNREFSAKRLLAVRLKANRQSWIVIPLPRASSEVRLRHCGYLVWPTAILSYPIQRWRLHRSFKREAGERSVKLYKRARQTGSKSEKSCQFERIDSSFLLQRESYFFYRFRLTIYLIRKASTRSVPLSSFHKFFHSFFCVFE